MSAETLREAAKVLRERADAATPGPWVQNGRNGIHTPIGACVATTARHDSERRKADAVYLNMMHPGVGLALADWLEDEIESAEYRERQQRDMEATRVRPEPFPVYYDRSTEKALAVAATILGGAS